MSCGRKQPAWGERARTAQEFNRQPLHPELTAATMLSRIDFILLDVQTLLCPGIKYVKVEPWSSRSWLVTRNKRWLSCLLTLCPVEARRDVYRKCSTLQHCSATRCSKREAVSLPSNSSVMKSLFLTPLSLMRLHRTILKLFLFCLFFF